MTLFILFRFLNKQVLIINLFVCMKLICGCDKEFQKNRRAYCGKKSLPSWGCMPRQLPGAFCLLGTPLHRGAHADCSNCFCNRAACPSAGLLLSPLHSHSSSESHPTPEEQGGGAPGSHPVCPATSCLCGPTGSTPGARSGFCAAFPPPRACALVWTHMLITAHSTSLCHTPFTHFHRHSLYSHSGLFSWVGPLNR